MTARSRFGGNAPWESIVGYSRAIRSGDAIHVSGTTALDEHGRLVGERDADALTRRILGSIADVLDRAGAGVEHVVRTRIYVTDVSRWQEIGRAHGEFFRDVRPTTAMVEVSALIDPGMLVEIEVEARP
ncbi:MAG TPA: RidA family protein [Candidatus Polarisedimenticolaceae bacterium]|nr:RidA family protein [Candidatus Polarisedimenticolaceae bacterium]